MHDDKICQIRPVKIFYHEQIYIRVIKLISGVRLTKLKKKTLHALRSPENIFLCDDIIFGIELINLVAWESCVLQTRKYLWALESFFRVSFGEK